MLYMVIERYLSGPRPVYQRATTRGRMLPEGLRYIDSWVVDDGGMSRCFQLMETSDPGLFDVWAERWGDLVSFEVIPRDDVRRGGGARRGAPAARASLTAGCREARRSS
jgi:Protein of unknown function (DUF3303)